MEENYYEELFKNAVEKAIEKEINKERSFRVRLNPDTCEREKYYLTEYKQDKQSLIAALAENTVVQKLWHWMKENNYHKSRIIVEKFCNVVDKLSLIEGDGQIIYGSLRTKHFKSLNISSKYDPIYFELEDCEEEIISELQKYCKKEGEMEKIIDIVEEYSNAQYLNQVNQLKERIKKVEKYMTYEQTKSIVEEALHENRREFIKALISLGYGIDDQDVLERVYIDFIQEPGVILLNDAFDDFVNEEVTKKHKEEKSLSL